MLAEKPVIILGGGGHATVVADMLKVLNKSILGFVAPNESQMKNFPDIAYLGNDSVLLTRYSPEEVWLVNGVGSISAEKNKVRYNLYCFFKEKGYTFATLVHPSVTLADTVCLEEGAQVMAGAIIQPNVVVQQNAIINTRASIDHDCHIGHSAHIAPGVVLSGNVVVEKNAFVGVGATIIQGITVGNHAMICAGRTVASNVSPETKYKE